MKVFSCGKLFFLVFFFFIITTGCLFAEESDGLTARGIDPASYIGFTLEMLFNELGIPESVYAVRGNEVWQDDVVFVYSNIEVYVFKDRVWQLCFLSVYDMKMGDTIDQIKGIIGEPLVSTEQYLLYRLPSHAWPMMLRINLNQEGRAASFFIYRADF